MRDIMILKKIDLINFRNYEKLSVRFYKGINIIYGDNAQGKTNLLESIYVLGITKSHRSFIDNNLIMDAKNFSSISGIINKGSLDINLKIIIENNKKVLNIDNSIIKRISDYISNMNIIIFYPDDLELLKGSPQIRRKYFNLELSQLYSNYYIVLNEYNKLLKIRNEYLKKMANKIYVDKNYFDILTNYLVDKAIILIKMRRKYVEKINNYSHKIFKDIMELDNFNLKYIPSIDIVYDNEDNYKENIIKFFNDKLYYDIKMCSTTYGPHKDDYEFLLDNINLKNYGSQGQQRIAVLCLKLSEIEIFKKYKETTPILLLDDVFSELSDDKKNNLLKYISKDIQTIITTTELNNLDKKLIKKSKLFKIESGKLIKIKEVTNNE
jgi:DNA replication and repair protein RecF